MTDELEDQMIAKAQVLEGEKKDSEAVAVSEDLVKIDPKDAIVWFVAGKAHYVSGQYEEALSCFSRAAEIEKERPEIWHMMAYALISLRRYPEAEEALQFVADAQPENTEARCILSFVQLISGKAREGAPNFKAAVGEDAALTFQMANHFYEKCISKGEDVSAMTKAMVERTLETLRLLKVQGQ
jgi:tetratricopeptide (TPR) repeat protein